MQKATITDPVMDLEQLLFDLVQLAETFLALENAFDSNAGLPECALTQPVNTLREKVRLANAAYCMLFHPGT